VKSRAFRLAPRARDRFEEIAEWTRGRFGPAQARVYLNQIIERCERLASGELPSRSCRDVFVLDLREDLRFVRAGRHLIIFVDTGREVVVIDFLHQSSDLTRRLGALGGDEAR
jgi:plasmid stabilization system protein ParE